MVIFGRTWSKAKDMKVSLTLLMRVKYLLGIYLTAQEQPPTETSVHQPQCCPHRVLGETAARPGHPEGPLCRGDKGDTAPQVSPSTGLPVLCLSCVSTEVSEPPAMPATTMPTCPSYWSQRKLWTQRETKYPQWSLNMVMAFSWSV